MGSQNPDGGTGASARERAGAGGPSGDAVGRLEPRCGRRRLLSAAGVAVAGGLAGCSRISSYTFEAEPVVVPEDARGSLGLAETVRRSVTREHRRDVEGVTVTATVTSHVAVYEATSGGPWPGASAGVGVLSTPAARLMGRSLNPLSGIPLRDLLTDPRAEPVLGQSGLVEEGPVEWRRGPTALATASADPPPSLVGAGAPLRSFGAVVAGDGGPGAAFVHAARAAPTDNVVLAAAVHRHPVDGTAGPYVGPDGFVPRSTVEGARGTTREAVEAMVLAE